MFEPTERVPSAPVRVHTQSPCDFVLEISGFYITGTTRSTISPDFTSVLHSLSAEHVALGANIDYRTVTQRSRATGLIISGRMVVIKFSQDYPEGEDDKRVALPYGGFQVRMVDSTAVDIQKGLVESGPATNQELLITASRSDSYTMELSPIVSSWGNSEVTTGFEEVPTMNPHRRILFDSWEKVTVQAGSEIMVLAGFDPKADSDLIRKTLQAAGQFAIHVRGLLGGRGVEFGRIGEFTGPFGQRTVNLLDVLYSQNPQR